MQLLTDDKASLVIILQGREQMWALRAKITVPRKNITDIRFEPKFQDWRKWEVRMPGTALPKVLLAGSYWTEEGWDFLYLKKPHHGLFKPVIEDVLVVETDQNRYQRLLLSCDRANANRVMRWYKSSNRTKH